MIITSLGYQISHRFSSLVRSRLASDLILQGQLRPFAKCQPGQELIEALTSMNRNKFPMYRDEIEDTAEGSGVPLLDIVLINFRKEILPFIPKEESHLHEDMADDCSDVMVVSDSMAFIAHNEDGNVALIGHTYLIKVILPDGQSFTAYTYARELPSCAINNKDISHDSQQVMCYERYRKRDDQDICQFSDAYIEREEECGICMEMNSKIVLPNCNHVMCLKCYRECQVMTLLKNRGEKTAYDAVFASGSFKKTMIKRLVDQHWMARLERDPMRIAVQRVKGRHLLESCRWKRKRNMNFLPRKN